MSWSDGLIEQMNDDEANLCSIKEIKKAIANPLFEPSPKPSRINWAAQPLQKKTITFSGS